MVGVLFDLNVWDLTKGVASYTFPLLWIMIKSLWPVLIILIIFKVIEVWLPQYIHRKKTETNFKNGEKWRSDRDLIYWLRGMHPSEFEAYIAYLFSKLGYKTEVIGGSHDGGVDVVAEKNGIKHYIQCKKFITREAGIAALRDFYGAIADHLSNGKGYFITTNKFTLEAERFTEDKPIELIDGYRLIEYIRLTEEKDSSQVSVEQGKQAAEKFIIGVYHNSGEKCPNCGTDLIKRIGKFGEFYGCSNYPKCKFTKEIVNR